MRIFVSYGYTLERSAKVNRVYSVTTLNIRQKRAWFRVIAIKAVMKDQQAR